MVSIPTTLRSEGATELTGDIQIQCTGGTAPVAGASVPTATIIVNMSAPVTSRILNSNGASEAVLLIDEPGNPSQVIAGSPGSNLAQVTVPFTGITTVSTPYFVGTAPTLTGGLTATEACQVVSAGGACTTGPENVFQGYVPLNGTNSSTQVIFPNVPILPPGPGFTRVFRIANIRVSAASLNVTSLSPFGAGNVQATVNITNNVSSLVPATVNVGGTQQGLASTSNVQTTSGVAATSGAGIASLAFLQCVAVPANGSTPVAGAVLNYVAAFNGAFKTRVSSNATIAFTGAGAGNNGLTIPTAGAPFQNVPGVQDPYSESGLILPGLTGGGATAGLADTGTRLKAVFNNIPAGVTVYVTVSNVVPNGAVIGSTTGAGAGLVNNVPTFTSAAITGASNPPIALLVLNPLAPDISGAVQTPFTTATVGGEGLYPVPLTNGAGEVDWEVVQGNIQATQDLQFGVFFTYSLPIASTKGGATPTVGMSYSPTPPTPPINIGYPAQYVNLPATASQAPIPRFIDTTAQHTFPILSIGLCQTLLLFPFVTNTSGFETGLAIANTTMDPLTGIAAQSGTCTLSFYGNNVLPSSTGATIGGQTVGANGAINLTPTAASPFPGATTAVVPAGGVWADTLTHVSGAAGNFEGYVFALCNFQFAHGYAFLTDTTATHFAQGYLALVVGPTGARAGAPASEGLNQ